VNADTGQYTGNSTKHFRCSVGVLLSQDAAILTVTRAINEHAHNPKQILAASSNLRVASTTSDIITAPIRPIPNSRQMQTPTKLYHKHKTSTLLSSLSYT